MPTESITKSFLSQGARVISIVVCAVVGFNYMGDRNEVAIQKAFDNKCKPLFEDNIYLKAFAKENRLLINEQSIDAGYTKLSVNLFIDAYNKKYKTTFLRPLDIEEKCYKQGK